MDQETQKIGQSDNNSNNTPSNDNSQQRAPKRQKEQTFEELRTLFISGLPADIKEREVHNLMRFFPGYEGCVLNLNEAAGRPVCFASFTDRNSALRALRVVQDLRFDPNVAQTLRVEFAKTNSKARRLPPEFYAEKRRKAPLAAAASSYFGEFPPSSYGATPTEASWVNPSMLVPWFQNMNLNRPPAGPPGYEMRPVPFPQGAYPNPSAPSPPSPKVPPCSTLFIANIHPDVHERDVTRVFRNMPGFRRLRLSTKDGVTFCFAEFNDVQSSTYSMNNLQGVPVGPTCMRIEYARTRMGDIKRQKDAQSQSQEEGQVLVDQIGEGDLLDQ